MCFEQEKRKENFTICLDVGKMTGKSFKNVLVFRNLKTFFRCCLQTIKEEYTMQMYHKNRRKTGFNFKVSFRFRTICCLYRHQNN